MSNGTTSDAPAANSGDLVGRVGRDGNGNAAGGASADPLDSLDPELARILRHDIKTPLQAASLNLELLALEQDGNADVTEAIASIQASLDTAVAMLQRFEHG